MLLRSLVTVAGALAAAQRAYAAVAIGSVHFTSTAAMALQNAQQVQSIMLTHHDVEQHAHIGLVHDGDGRAPGSGGGRRSEKRVCTSVRPTMPVRRASSNMHAFPGGRVG